MIGHNQVRTEVAFLISQCLDDRAGLGIVIKHMSGVYFRIGSYTEPQLIYKGEYLDVERDSRIAVQE